MPMQIYVNGFFCRNAIELVSSFVQTGLITFFGKLVAAKVSQAKFNFHVRRNKCIH